MTIGKKWIESRIKRHKRKIKKLPDSESLVFGDEMKILEGQIKELKIILKCFKGEKR